MAKLKAAPKNFAEANQILGNRGSIRLGNNTYLLRQDLQNITVRLHDTDIVRFHADGRVNLFTAGYRTVTTKDRINQFIAGAVYQKNWGWFFAPRVDGRTAFEQSSIFEEGMDAR